MNKNLSRKIFCTLIVFFTLFSTAYSDTLVSYADLTFHSSLEKQLFDRMHEEKQIDFLALYLSIDSTISTQDYQTYRKQMDQALNKFTTPSFKESKESKQVKKVYSSIHDQFLKKYDIKSFFSQIFSTGLYQCVTSSMLYTVVFSDLNIPFEIKELPNHVYLTAFPETSKIVVETTNPIEGIKTYDRHFKAKFNKYLLDYKLISQIESDTTDTDELFYRYFEKPKLIDKMQLASIQYANMALLELEKQNGIAAFRLMNKSYYLYPNEKNSFLLLISLALTIEQMSVAQTDYASYIGKLSRFQGKIITSDAILDYFIKITKRQLDYEGNVAQYDSSYAIISREVKDSLTKSELSFVYNLERGRLLFNQKKFVQAQPFAEKAYSLKPTNHDAELLFVGSIVANVENRRMNDAAAEDILNQMEGYLATYPQLDSNKPFNQLRLFICLSLMDEYFFSNNLEKAEQYRQKFEQIYNPETNRDPNVSNILPHAYATGASYYFKKGNYQKAREILKKGLIYAPDDYLLTSRLNALR